MGGTGYLDLSGTTSKKTLTFYICSLRCCELEVVDSLLDLDISYTIVLSLTVSCSGAVSWRW